MINWAESTLGETCELYQPKTISTKEMVADGVYPVFGANGIIGRYDKFNHDEPQLLVTCRGATCGSVNISLPKSWITGNAMVVRPKQNSLSLGFLEYFFRGACDFSKVITGSAQPQITRQTFAPVKIKIPPLSEQRRIVAVLDEAFEGLAIATANTEKNLKNARELFDVYLSAVFEEKGEDWIEKTIGDVCRLRSGTTVDSKLERPHGDMPYLKVADMTLAENLDEVTTSSRFLLRNDVKDVQVLPVGTVIFPKRGGAILTNKKRRLVVEICADLNIMGAIPTPEICSEFLFMYFLNVDMRKLGSGSSIPQINNYDISPLRIGYPRTLGKQIQIAEKFREFSARVSELENCARQKLAAIAELKQSLLQKAFAGELTKDFRPEVEAALA